MASARPRGVALALLVWAGLATSAHAQDPAGASRPVQVTGAVNVNSQGISTVPALTLGRPAAIFDLAVRKGDVSFEPQFRFALDGTPWSFLLWGRYRAVQGERFRLTVGGHPAYSFRARPAVVDGRTRDVIDVRRYFAAEATPTWVLTRRTSAGAYYLYSRGVDPGAPRHTHLIAARTYVASVPVFRDYVVQAAPQVYYLRTNGQDGTYFSASASIGPRGAPWSITTIVNQPIRSEVAGGQAFLWNVGMTYAIR
jgi:hypothetical protein